MLDCLKAINWKKTGVFAAGVLFGTAGIKVLSSKDAKKVYTNCTAAVLRAKECVMNTVTTVQENAEDIYEGAKQINEERAEAKAAAEFAEDYKEDVADIKRAVDVSVQSEFSLHRADTSDMQCVLNVYNKISDIIYNRLRWWEKIVFRYVYCF